MLYPSHGLNFFIPVIGWYFTLFLLLWPSCRMFWTFYFYVTELRASLPDVRQSGFPNLSLYIAIVAQFVLLDFTASYVALGITIWTWGSWIETWYTPSIIAFQTKFLSLFLLNFTFHAFPIKAQVTNLIKSHYSNEYSPSPSFLFCYLFIFEKNIYIGKLFM